MANTLHTAEPPPLKKHANPSHTETPGTNCFLPRHSPLKTQTCLPRKTVLTAAASEYGPQARMLCRNARFTTNIANSSSSCCSPPAPPRKKTEFTAELPAHCSPPQPLNMFKLESSVQNVRFTKTATPPSPPPFAPRSPPRAPQ